jgi:hypothetical protein
MRRSAFFLSVVLAVCIVGASWAQPGGDRPGGGRAGGGRGRGGEPGERIEPKDLKFELGVDAIPDRELFEKLSYQGPDVMIDGYLANLEFVKFIIENPQGDNVRVYFMNTMNYRAHPPYMRMVGIDQRSVVRGAITYLPRLRSPSGSPGLYILDFEPNDSYTFDEIKYIRDELTTKMPILKDRVAFHPLRGNVAQYEADKDKYTTAKFPVHLDSDLYKNIAFLPLNSAESYGMLRVMDNDTRPSPRDIVICATLPNQMPRVAGVISEERQTPLSHVNLRAIQDRIPNAFVEGASQDKAISGLIGKLVHYKVTPQGYTIREATEAQVEEHFASVRPTEAQVPKRDLTVQEIKPLGDVGFAGSSIFGVKTANLSAMQKFKLEPGTVPDGYAVPFYFYDEFMKHNGLYDAVDALLADETFQQDRDVRRKKLKELRTQVKAAESPAWMVESLGKVQAMFGEGASIRCRSSTNNEDLPGFSGAGLYDSFTHKADEGHLEKSIKQVFASIWNFRAFEEREFYRIDHKMAAMGVLLHVNFSDEKANGVAVTDDILYESQQNYYINTQLGEDLVTNPEATSSPEEVLLGWWADQGHQVVRRSTEAGDDGQLLSKEHLAQLRKSLTQIHGRFQRLYGAPENAPFAMEIEFKITNEGKLIIKQARPWVF